MPIIATRVCIIIVFFLLTSTIKLQAKVFHSEDVKKVQDASQQATTECHNEPADIVFLVDESGSVGTKHFHDIMNFIKSLVEKFDIGPKAVQVGVVKFSKEVTEVFPLNSHHVKDSLANDIANIPYRPGRATMTDKALEFLRQRSLVPSRGERPGVPGMGILITDGKSWYTSRTVQQAQMAKKAGIILVAIGIGRKVNEKELNNIASEPIEDNVMLVKDMATLRKISEYIANMTCKDIKEANSEHHVPVNTTTAGQTNATSPNTRESPSSKNGHWYSNLPFHPAYIAVIIIGIGGLIMLTCCIVALCCKKKPDDKKPLLDS